MNWKNIYDPLPRHARRRHLPAGIDYSGDCVMVQKYLKDMAFTVIANPEEYHVDYQIYEVTGWLMDGQPLYGDQQEFEEITEKTPKFAHGFVKWDGCSNWHFDVMDDCMIHGCTRKDVQRIGDVLGICWDWTKELCSNWIDL